jgi:hypothetical protein
VGSAHVGLCYEFILLGGRLSFVDILDQIICRSVLAVLRDTNLFTETCFSDIALIAVMLHIVSGANTTPQSSPY